MVTAKIVICMQLSLCNIATMFVAHTHIHAHEDMNDIFTQMFELLE